MSRNGYVVIGGGIVGASIAYHLSKRTDESITLLERQSFASETTTKSWALYSFHGGQHQFEMKQYGLDLYNRFLAEPRSSCRYELTGQLGLATSEEGAETFRSAIKGSVAEYDSLTSGAEHDHIEFLEPDELSRSVFAPYIDTGAVTGVLYRPRVGYFRPRELAFEFLERARENGVELRSNTPVTNVLTDEGRAIGVETTEGELRADEVICAAGPWNPSVGEMAGVDMPVKHTLAPVLQVHPDPTLTQTFPFMKHEETRITYRGRPDGSVLIGRNPSEITEFDEAKRYDPGTVGETIPPEIRREMTDVTEMLAPTLAEAPVEEEYVGIRSKTPDGNPVIGRTELKGFSVAAFNSSGIQLAPATGRIVADQLVDDDPSSWYDTVSISRFEGYRDTF